MAGAKLQSSCRAVEYKQRLLLLNMVSAAYCHCCPVPLASEMQHVTQANTKWYEGALNQSIYWAISDDSGLTWGPTRVLMPSPDSLPLWGPVQYSAVRSFCPSGP